MNNIGLDSGSMDKKNNQTLENLCQIFTRELKNRSKSPSTILAYSKDIEQLTQYLLEKNKKTPVEVTPSDIENFRNSLEEKGYTAKSISRKLNAIKTFFRWMISQKILENDPAAPVAHPKYNNPAPRILSRMEYRALRDAARNDKRMAAIIELMLQTGMRISEVANLQVKDINADSVKIQAYASQPEREVPLNRVAKQALDAYLAERKVGNNKHVFITKNGKPLLVRNIRSSIDRFFREAGIENAKVNDLRNTFIAHQLRAGVDVVTVSKIVGHKRLSTTERYLEFIEGKPNKRNTKLEEL